MKTKLFIYSISDRKISKTSGGSKYTINVYEVTKDNNLTFVTEATAHTGNHKGEDSEAFGALIMQRPEIKKQLIRRAKTELKTDSNSWAATSILRDIDNSGGYYSSHYEQFGIRLKYVKSA